MEETPNFNEISDIEKYMVFEGINCKKYNYSLDSDVQMLSCQAATLYLHEGLESIILIN